MKVVVEAVVLIDLMLLGAVLGGVALRLYGGVGRRAESREVRAERRKEQETDRARSQVGAIED